jgi:SAM-dependent methyltransferase
VIGQQLSPALKAFDAVAPVFDARFGEWLSVDAQRAAVRRALLSSLQPGGRILELGGGTGEDATWLAQRGFDLTLTDGSPAMVAIAQEKLSILGSRATVAPLEELDAFGERHISLNGKLFDGAFSNFASLNCVEDLRPVGRGLAKLVRRGAPAMLVLFGTLSPGEMFVETLRGRPRQSLRRFQRGPVPARLAGQAFNVTYHRRDALRDAMRPWFRLVKTVGIGIFVPPSAAEPWISRHSRMLRLLAALDRSSERVLARFADHVLYHFERTDAAAP